MAKAVAQIWTVQNNAGQGLGRYRAISAQAAIRRFLEEQAATAATFRRSQPMLQFSSLTATVDKGDKI